MSEKSVQAREREKAEAFDEELFLEIAARAEGARTIEFARRALTGLMAMGLELTEPVFPGRVASMYRREKVSFLQLASGFPTPGCPMLRAVLEQGAKPDENCDPEGLTPLMNAAMYGNSEAAILLSEAGASWTWRTGRQDGPKASLLGQSPAERLLGLGPQESRLISKEDKMKGAAAWEKACGLAIAALKGKSASAGLAAFTLGDCDMKPVRKRLLGKLAEAGASPNQLVSGCQEKGWPGSAATPVWLAAQLAGQHGDPERLFETLEAFPKETEESMSSLLAAVGMGLISASENDELSWQECWMPEKKRQRLARELAESDPLATLKIKGDERGASFAAALGAMCVERSCSAKAFKEISEFWGLWLAAAREAGTTLEMSEVAEKLGQGGLGRARMIARSKEGQIWPGREELAQAKERALTLLGADAELAEQGPVWTGAWLSAWAALANEKGPGERRLDRLAKGFEEFIEALSDELGASQGVEAEALNGAWAAVASAAGKAAGADLSLARMERVAALASTHGGSQQRAKARAKPRI